MGFWSFGLCQKPTRWHRLRQQASNPDKPENRENSKFRIENSEQFIANQATYLIEGENSKFRIAIPEQIIAE